MWVREVEEGSGWPESEMDSESEVGSELEGIMEEEVGAEMIEVVWPVTKVWQLSSDLCSQ